MLSVIPTTQLNLIILSQLQFSILVYSQLILTYRTFNLVSLFGTIKKMQNNLHNIKLFLNYITFFISNRNLKNNREHNILCLTSFGKAAWNFILAIYNNKWNNLKVDNNNIMFYCKVSAQFRNKINIGTTNNISKNIIPSKLIKFSNLPPLPSVPPKPSKEELNKLKFHNKNKSFSNCSGRKEGYIYVQALTKNIFDILKLK